MTKTERRPSARSRPRSTRRSTGWHARASWGGSSASDNSDLGADEVLEGLAAADEPHAPVFDHDLGRAGAHVVGGGHGEAVGARVSDGQQLAPLDALQLPVARERVRGLADRPHDVYVAGLAAL